MDSFGLVQQSGIEIEILKNNCCGLRQLEQRQLQDVSFAKFCTVDGSLHQHLGVMTIQDPAMRLSCNNDTSSGHLSGLKKASNLSESNSCAVSPKAIECGCCNMNLGFDNHGVVVVGSIRLKLLGSIHRVARPGDHSVHLKWLVQSPPKASKNLKPMNH